MFSKCILRNGTEHQIELTCDIYDIALFCLSSACPNCDRDCCTSVRSSVQVNSNSY